MKKGVFLKFPVKDIQPAASLWQKFTWLKNIQQFSIPLISSGKAKLSMASCFLHNLAELVIGSDDKKFYHSASGHKKPVKIGNGNKFLPMGTIERGKRECSSIYLSGTYSVTNRHFRNMVFYIMPFLL